MECPLCLDERVETVSVFSNCCHFVCKTCASSPNMGALCPVCRGEMGKTLDYPADVFSTLTSDGSSEFTPFDVLFSLRCKDLYEMTRNILVLKWTEKKEFTYTDVCGVCLLKQRRPEVNITLLNLFYACATITRNTVLDAMTCLLILFGRGACLSLSPKDVYFHFFLNHCDTKKGAFDCPTHTPVADFVCRTHHSMIYDIPEVDSLAHFITTIHVESFIACECNESQHVLKIMHEGEGGTGSHNSSDPDECGLFIPTVSETDLVTNNNTVGWGNGYKWTFEVPDVECGCEDGEDEVQHMSVDCLKVFSNCRVCTDMMEVNSNRRLTDVNRLVTQYCEFTNVPTAVHMACTELNFPSKEIDDMTAHYTSPTCELNRRRHIHFYSLVKQPSALMNPVSTQHLFSELFSCKRSYLCPTYHLACICDKISDLDKSSLKRTKRDTINKWAKKILERHRPTHRTSKYKRVRI